MICRVESGEVVLSHATISDLFAVLTIILHKDKEIVFTPPEDSYEKAE